MGGEICPMMMGGAGTKVEVKKLDKVVRLPKMAEAMRLMHEATAP